MGCHKGPSFGPLLFLVYINDLPNSSKKLKAILFADDSAAYASSECIETLTGVVNTELNNLSEWFKANKLSLNIAKTHFLVIGKNNHEDRVRIQINGNAIAQERHIKFLGIIVDDKLDWREHINFISHKINSSLFALRNARTCINEDTSKLLYYTLIYPYLSTGLHLWGSTFKCHTDRISILQKKAIRVIAGAPRLEHTMPLFEKLHILPLTDLYRFSLGQFMYRQIYIHNPAAGMFNVVYNNSIHEHFTRGAQKAHTIYRRTEKVRNSFLNVGPHYWSNLPLNISSAKTINAFNRSHKRYLRQALSI